MGKCQIIAGRLDLVLWGTMSTLAAVLCTASLQGAGREVAITIDDLPRGLGGGKAAWEAETARVLGGKEYVTLAGDDDWSPESGTWEAALEELDRSHAALHEAIGKFPDERLREKVAGKEFSFYGLLLGVVQHNVYHAGQIGLLRKAQ